MCDDAIKPLLNTNNPSTPNTTYFFNELWSTIHLTCDQGYTFHGGHYEVTVDCSCATGVTDLVAMLSSQETTCELEGMSSHVYYNKPTCT